ncbi:hypothetical protein GCM10025868_16500 [Angustibacter aerolatus]|uniref:Uncharacterized protein n=1 Tax=Angustibacter aerolatus TaxID=1162965 RepID=A0ABQ6JDY7_9ACTN|nr:hypothetical protein [Angustibacter aerolatus]GMA86400.1 hypothetical protein GCM10025868_16500 [Angustibacter aerolatus]
MVNQSGMRLLVSALQHKGSDYRAMVDRVRGECPRLEDVVFIGTDSWTQARRARRARRPPPAGRAAGDALARRPDQHPVH